MTEEDKHSWVHRELAQQYHCLSVVGSQDYWNSQQKDAEGEEERTMITIRHEIDEYGKSEQMYLCRLSGDMERVMVATRYRMERTPSNKFGHGPVHQGRPGNTKFQKPVQRHGGLHQKTHHEARVREIQHPS